MALLAVVLELADVVGGEEVGRLDRPRARSSASKSMGRTSQRSPSASGPIGGRGSLDDRRGGDDDLGARDGVELVDAAASTSPSALDPLRVAGRTRGSGRRDSASGGAARGRRPARRSRRSPRSASPSGANRRTQTPLAAAVRAAVISAPSMIADRQPGLRVVQDDQPRDVREPARLVRRVARDPLERHHVVVARGRPASRG